MEYIVKGIRPKSEEMQTLNAGLVSEDDAKIYLHRRIREGCREVTIHGGHDWAGPERPNPSP